MAQKMNAETLLASVGGNRALLREMALLCLSEDGPRLLAQLHDSMRAGDCAGIESAAHALKGLVAEFHAESATRAANALETAARDGNCGDLAAQLDDFDREYDKLASLLRATLDTSD